MVKFYGKSNGGSLDNLNRCSDPEMSPEGQIGAKISKNLKFEHGEKLDHRYTVKFHSESNGDSLKALKRCLDPEMGQKTKYMAKITKFKI